MEQAIGLPPMFVVGNTTTTERCQHRVHKPLWGMDFNGVWNLHRGRNWTIDLLAGFRYYDLEESLIMNAVTRYK